jgi:crotonobetainyl-CoA:carnitine CoA-transferase CaiB-like acyl-CoA transferase
MIRVLELGNFIAGPFCGKLLGDMGADVVKVEPPRGGDMTRNTPPHLNGESANFIAINRNKRSIALDLKRAQARDAFLRLAAVSDVLIENFRPGRMAELGLGAEDVRRVNPAIVYVSVSGFGQSGPLTQRAAVNLVIEARRERSRCRASPEDCRCAPASRPATSSARCSPRTPRCPA